MLILILSARTRQTKYMWLCINKILDILLISTQYTHHALKVLSVTVKNQ